jgi:hypothetical protein
MKGYLRTDAAFREDAPVAGARLVGYNAPPSDKRSRMRERNHPAQSSGEVTILQNITVTCSTTALRVV